MSKPKITPSGILNIDKPANLTSHDIVAQVRQLLKLQYPSFKIKVGHTGTLDPFATGVLLVAIGSATRLIEYSHDWNKTYRATITLGATSDTDDITGQITKTKNINKQTTTKLHIKNTLKQFIGTTQQKPPIYSAKKIIGERAYKLARQGSRVSLSPNQVTIHHIKLASYSYPDFSLLISCSTGTYIRSLARDLGDKLNTGAYVKQLRRTSIGSHKITDSVKLNQLTPDSLTEYLLPPQTLIAHLPSITISASNVAQFKKGLPIGSTKLTQQLKTSLSTQQTSHSYNLLAIFSPSATLVGIAHYDCTSRLLSPKKVLI